MAKITGTTNEAVYSIPKWLGLNEHPDGDTRLKLGEASVMENWRITRDGNLKRRPGLRHVFGLRQGYQISVDANNVTIQTIKSTDDITVYTSVSAISPIGGAPSILSTDKRVGQMVLNTGETMRASAAAALTGNHYLFYNEKAYRITASSWTLSGGIYTIKGKRVRAIAVNEEKPIAGMWSGYVGRTEMFIVACDNTLWRIYSPTGSNPYAVTIGSVGGIRTDKGVSFLPWDDDLYILNGFDYYVYDGNDLTTVTGYRPLVAIAISPLLDGVGAESGETTGEYVNRLNGLRRVWISPDGNENKTFQLPEKNLASVDYVRRRTNPSATINFSADLSAGQVTISSTLAKGVNTYEIGYTMSTTYRSQVTGNLFAELFSGTQDTRIFLYGDGTNRALYSGMDTDGMPRADYFPDSYEVRVGAGNTPITAMVRHYSTLITYKPNECWSLQHGIVELATDELTPAVYSQPVNRDIGNVAPGQVRLVNNDPISLHRHELYDWSNSSYYTSNLSRDERQAKRISDKVQKSIRSLALKSAKTWDDNDNQEYYVAYNGTAIVWNYANNTWYKYTNFPMACMCNFQGNLYMGSTDGTVYLLTDNQRTDDGDEVVASWKSGAMDFGSSYARKYCSMLWVGLKPLMNSRGTVELQTSATVSVQTDRKDTFRQKVALSNKARVDGEPFTVKIKLKAKKFVFYHLLLSVDDFQYPVTVTNVDFRVRQTGYAK